VRGELVHLHIFESARTRTVRCFSECGGERPLTIGAYRERLLLLGSQPDRKPANQRRDWQMHDIVALIRSPAVRGDRAMSAAALLLASVITTAVACSSSTEGAAVDGGAASTCVPGRSSTGFPCCYFWAPATVDSGAGGECRADSCITGSLMDGGPPGAVACPDGYESAVLCATPLGGCGGEPTCCKSAM
jgi:hypothetical protein